jgi:SNF2 family DNA or RNA helicase
VPVMKPLPVPQPRIHGALPLRPRFDPSAPGALVLQEPGAADTVAVVVDPFLSQHMRPHQRDGVRFMWECVQGCRGPEQGDARGCILADAMGLGKTLQTIALVWTLLKQSSTGCAAVSRAVVVCPSSLVGNWRAEFKKWLGDERVRPIAVTSQGTEAEDAVRTFIAGAAAVRSVLIVSYEMLRKHVGLLTEPGSRIGVLVCDEAHRLKSSAGSKTLTALGAISTARRVLLTGTPIQNDLGELFAMVRVVRRAVRCLLTTPPPPPPPSSD